MTNKEAINVLKLMASSIELGGYNEKWISAFKEAYELAIKALENMPKKGKWTKNRIISCGTILKNGSNVLEQQCTECERFNIKWVDSIPNNFCPHCGAQLSEEGEE